MRRIRRGLGVVALLSMAAASGCGASTPTVNACTLVGCADGFSATVTQGPGGFPAGMHEIDVTADGTKLTCTFVFDAPAAARGQLPTAQCSPGLYVFIQPVQTCSTTSDGYTTTEQCQAVPGQFRELLNVTGAPVVVRVQQSVEGTTVLDQSVMPTYSNVQPNGPGCDPICRQGGANWTLQ